MMRTGIRESVATRTTGSNGVCTRPGSSWLHAAAEFSAMRVYPAGVEREDERRRANCGREQREDENAHDEWRVGSDRSASCTSSVRSAGSASSARTSDASAKRARCLARLPPRRHGWCAESSHGREAMCERPLGACVHRTRARSSACPSVLQREPWRWRSAAQQTRVPDRRGAAVARIAVAAPTERLRSPCWYGHLPPRSRRERDPA
jgi:hypothetical protein